MSTAPPSSQAISPLPVSSAPSSPATISSNVAPSANSGAVSSLNTSSKSQPPVSSKQPKPGQEKPETWFDDAAFIGNSRTEGLRDYDGLGNASYLASKGLMVNTVYKEKSIRVNGKKMTVMKALRQKKFGKVYIMLGINELGWSTFQSFVDDYGKIIDDVKRYQPDAKIYLQSILPVTAKKSASSKIYTNAKITQYNEAIRGIAKDKKVFYLTVYEAVQDSSGALPEKAATDGVHLNREYCKKWCEYLRTHTE